MKVLTSLLLPTEIVTEFRKLTKETVFKIDSSVINLYVFENEFNTNDCLKLRTSCKLPAQVHDEGSEE